MRGRARNGAPSPDWATRSKTYHPRSLRSLGRRPRSTAEARSDVRAVNEARQLRTALTAMKPMGQILENRRTVQLRPCYQSKDHGLLAPGKQLRAEPLAMKEGRYSNEAETAIELVPLEQPEEQLDNPVYEWRLTLDAQGQPP